MKKILLIGLMLLPVSLTGLSAQASDAQWEARLTKAWKALSSQQRSVLKPNEQVWIKYKDSLDEFNRHQELIARTNFLANYKIDEAGALEGERSRLDWHSIERAQGLRVPGHISWEQAQSEARAISQEVSAQEAQSEQEHINPEWEQAVLQAWDKLTTQQQVDLKQGQLNWRDYLLTLHNAQDVNEALKARATFLEVYKAGDMKMADYYLNKSFPGFKD